MYIHLYYIVIIYLFILYSDDWWLMSDQHVCTACNNIVYTIFIPRLGSNECQFGFKDCFINIYWYVLWHVLFIHTTPDR